MTFLLDENIDVRLAEHLVVAGHDVTAVARDYPHSLSDREILALALAEERVVITKDRDFGDLIFRDQLSHAGIVYLRMRGSFAAQRDRLTTVIADYTQHLSGFLTVTEGAVRVSSTGGSTQESR